MPAQPDVPQLDNQKQIQQMIGFIKAEANEKCQEIEQKASSEYERRFQELKRDKEQQIQSEFKTKRQNAHIQRLIECSHKKQDAASSLIVLRSNLVESIRVSAVKQLEGIEKHESYVQFIANLIVQGLIAIQEEQISVRCRKIDEPVVKKALKIAEDLFKKAVTDACGFTPVLEPLTIDTENYLPGPHKEGAIEYCLGGVDLVARKGKIVSNNTIDARLAQVFKHNLPHTRAYLFGEIVSRGNGDGQLPPHLLHY